MPPKKTTTSTAENRTFKPHPALLLSVIRNQAGTLGKAVLELVMNSIDAGATRVDIELTRHTIKVTDDGRGFVSRKEIDEFFETFGTPHEEGDGAVYGRFRIGRGQLMAFAKNTWESGEFRMVVDVEGKGLDYILETGRNPVRGCTIMGTIYDDMVLSPSELLSTVNELREQVRYTPIPVFLNGERVSEEMEKQKWTEITDDAYIRIDNKSTRLSIYNLGVLVCHQYSGSYGVGGVVVSRKPLEVNFARNDVIKARCPVWKRIKPLLDKHAREVGKNEPRHKVNDQWRDYMAQQMLVWAGEQEQARELNDARIFPDVTGKHWSINMLAGYKVTSIAVAPSVTLKADKVHQQGMAVVLDGEKLAARFSNKSFEDVLAVLTADPKWIDSPRWKEWVPLSRHASRIRETLVPFEKLASALTEEHFPQADKELSKSQVTAIEAIRSAQYAITKALESVIGSPVELRNIYAMRSDTANAYTDGETAVFLHEKFLNGPLGPARGFSWAVHVVNVLLHEYLHTTSTATGCHHDSEFYKLFHDTTTSEEFAEASRLLFARYADRLKTLPGHIAKDLNRAAYIEDLVARTAKAQEPVPAPEPEPNPMPASNGKRTTAVVSLLSKEELEARMRAPLSPAPQVEIVDGFELTGE